ncbi:MAG: glycosyltransferase family 2 protein [Patescibacteria group bacterium]|nr:glycosyltransferase family 2 protein [Patescibacteria group bacterium]
MKAQRFWEIFPAALAIITILTYVAFSRFLPSYAAIFVIIFDTYWLLKTVYFYFHLQSTEKELRKNIKTDWLKKLRIDPRTAERWGEIYHLIILPMYKEPLEIVEESFERLLQADYPKEKMLVVLAEEARAGEGAKEVGRRIGEKYGGKFFQFLVTSHPDGLSNEVPGKGSNETWAAREAQQKIIDRLGLDYEKVLVSVFDVDTQIARGYFAALTHAFLIAPHPQRSSYQPVPFFNNNIFESPALARVMAYSTTFWGMMEQSRPEHMVTFSSHSTPFRALAEIGFWDTDVVSEDSHIFWQLFSHYDGDWRVVPLKYPVSMDVNVGSNFWQTVRNLYKQQRRWAWGVENFPYIMLKFLKNGRMSPKDKLYRAYSVFGGSYSWATSALLISLGWLPVVLGGREFNRTVLSYNLPHVTRYLMWLGSFGIVISGILTLSLLPPKPRWFTARHYVVYFVQWLLTPINMIVLGTFPALESQIRLMLGGRFRLGFWATPKSRKTGARPARITAEGL